ncbi:MAG: betaine-aldehyde dehydrogenase, partial [Candidatus Nanopelagicaceae bacterium]
MFEYSPAPESRAVVKLKSDYGHFINGKWVAPLSKKMFASINPATEEILAKV